MDKANIDKRSDHSSSIKNGKLYTPPLFYRLQDIELENFDLYLLKRSIEVELQNMMLVTSSISSQKLISLLYNDADIPPNLLGIPHYAIFKYISNSDWNSVSDIMKMLIPRFDCRLSHVGVTINYYNGASQVLYMKCYADIYCSKNNLHGINFNLALSL